MSKITYQIKYWLPVYLYAGLIFYLSGISLPTVPVKMPAIDKIAHFFEYAILGLLIYRACLSGRQSGLGGQLDCPVWSGTPLSLRWTAGHLNSWLTSWLYRKRIFFSIFLSVLYAFSDELHQFFVPNRMMSEWDFLADALGAITAIVVILIIKPQIQKN
ncbi:MAG: VanZ family protein [Planctomycetota bacterium]